MSHRRLVGIDLGIATAHTVRVLDGEGTIVAKRKAWPTRESLTAVEAAALADCPEGARLELVIEPTGPAWLPVAVFLTARGHKVFRAGGTVPGVFRWSRSYPGFKEKVNQGPIVRVLVRNVSSGANEPDGAGQTGKSPMASS
jgi:hypothetical protein